MTKPDYQSFFTGKPKIRKKIYETENLDFGPLNKKNKIQKNISGPVNKYGPKSGPMFVWTVDLNCQFCHIFCQVCQLLFGDYYFSVVLSFKVTKGINYARYNCIYCINY